MVTGSRLVFGIDDLNPSFWQDGHCIEFNRLKDLCKDYPKLKITNFIPANYVFKEQKLHNAALKKVMSAFSMNPEKVLNKHEKDKNLLSNNPDFLKDVKSAKNMSFELHGYYHFNFKTASAMEFANLNYEETKKRVNDSINEFSSSGLDNPKVMCPPGWSAPVELIEVLKENKLKIAGNMYYGKIENYSFKCSGLIADPLKPTKIRGVLNIPRNFDIAEHTLVRADKILKAEGFLGLHAHVKNIGVSNGLTVENITRVRKLLDFLEKDYWNIEYSYFRDVN